MADVLISKSRSQQFIEGVKAPSTPSFINGDNPVPVDSGGDTSSGAFVPYDGASKDVDLGEHSILAESIGLNPNPVTIPTDQGSMYFDKKEETLAIILNGSTTKVGEDLFVQVKNQSGATIPKGTAVRFDGVLGASGRVKIVPFLADGSNPSLYFVGLTYENIPNGGDGKALFNGKIRGINTTSFEVGDILYCSPTVAGGFTTTKPIAPNNIISVAAVLSSSPNGILLVRTQIGSNINNDEGVKIVSPAGGDLLQYQSNGLWENRTVASLGLVPQSRTLSINGTTFDLTSNRSWTIPTHNPVTIGTPNGLSLAGQVLSLGLASATTTGALSSTHWNAFNNKVSSQWGTNGTSIFYNGGNVGIGTNSPIQKLHIGGVGSAIAFDTTGDSGSNTIKTIEDFKLSLKVARGTSSEIKIGNENLEFLTNSSERILITSSGSILINQTVSTGERLQVNGDIRINQTFGLMLIAPNGNRYRVTVNNTGTLVTTLT